MLSSFSFVHPWYFLLLGLFFLSERLFVRKKSAFYMPSNFSKLEDKSTKSRWLYVLKWLILFFTIVALCTPVIQKKVQTKKDNAIDMVLCLDASGSMSLNGFNLKDYNQTRLQAVKEVVEGFIAKRKEDRIGLVFFGTYSAVVSPLSFDKEAEIERVKSLQVGILGKSTALIDALLNGLGLLKESKAKSKVIILLSDGEDSSSLVNLKFVLKLAKKYKIKIYTIQIDSSQTDMMQVIAKANNTQAFHAKTKEDLAKVYASIDTLEKSKLLFKTILVQEQLFSYPLFLAIVATLLLLLLSKNREIF